MLHTITSSSRRGKMINSLYVILCFTPRVGRAFFFYLNITSVFCKNTRFLMILVFGGLFPGLFCSYVLLCLIVTFHLLLTCVPGVLCPSCAPWCPLPHLSLIILVTFLFFFVFPLTLRCFLCVSPVPRSCTVLVSTSVSFCTSTCPPWFVEFLQLWISVLWPVFWPPAFALVGFTLPAFVSLPS